MNDLPILEPLPRAGWPKHLPCPRCGRSRKTEGPGDRFHAECRLRVTELDTGPTVDLYEIRSAGRTPA